MLMRKFRLFRSVLRTLWWGLVAWVGAVASSVPAWGQEAADTTASSVSEKALKEVTVTGSTIRTEGNQDIITVTRNMRRGVRDAGELIGRIPGAFHHPVTKEITYMGSKNIIILVDSVEKDQAYIKKLRPYRFDKIYVIAPPQGKYSDYDAVISLHTREHYQGYEGEAGVQGQVFPGQRNGKGQALGLIMGDGSYTLTTGKWNFAATAQYKRRKAGYSNYYSSDYPLSHFSERTLEQPLSDPTGRSLVSVGSGSLAVDYQITPSQSVSLLWRTQRGATRSNQRQTLVSGHSPQEMSDTTLWHSSSDGHGLWSNSAGAFYRGTFGRWTISGSASYTFTSQRSSMLTTRGDYFDITDDRRLHTGYFWGGFDIWHRLSNNRWILGLSEYLTAVNYRERRQQTGVLLAENSQIRNSTHLTANYFPWRNVTVALSLGPQVMRTAWNGLSRTYWNLRVGAFVQWSAQSGKVSAKVSYSLRTGYPSLSDQQDYGQFSDSLIWRGGNPLLAPQKTHKASLMFTFWRKLTLRGTLVRAVGMPVPIVTPGYGQLPGGSEGWYARYLPENTDRTDWEVNLTYQGGFRTYWSYNISASLSSQRATFERWHFSKTRPSGSAMCYYSNPKICMAGLVYTLYGNFDAQPQGGSWGGEDDFYAVASKSFFKGRMETVFGVILPVHIVRNRTHSILRSEPLVQRGWTPAEHRNNWRMYFQLSYTFQGGKSVRKYRREIEQVE